jgi:hypothetical protein
MTKSDARRKMNIPTRAPRAKGGMFDNLRKPGEVESLSIEELTAPLDSTQLNSTQLDSPPLDSTQLSPVAPSRDFNKRANSIERDALPAGLFPGTSKKLYDALYLRTRGAVVPRRTIQATRTEVMRWAGIGGLNTFLSHIKHLTRVGLIIREFEIGNKEGATYEVRLPEELDSTQLTSTRLNSTRLRSTQLDSTPDRVHDSTQKVMRVESGKLVENKGATDDSKTSFKTKEENHDDEAAARRLIARMIEAERELTGKVSTSGEKWEELAEVLVGELRIAAARTTVSNVPSFLAEHLRRRLWKVDKARVTELSAVEEGSQPAVLTAEERRKCPDCGGMGFWYPEGPDKGVAKCKHLRLESVPAGDEGA